MKERLFAILATVALLVTVLRPAMPSNPFSVAVSAITPNADCHTGGQCSN